MQQGAYISGAAHVLLIGWALFAGFFLRSSDPLPIETMDVSVLSVAEFEALTVPDLPQPDEVAAPEPVAPPTPEDAIPLAEPEAEVTPEPAPSPEPPAPPPSEAAPDAPVLPEPPTPPEADRVAPEVAPESETPVEVAPEVVPEMQPAETGETIVEPEPAAAPEEAAPEIVTEAETPSSAAPVRSMRPMARPSFKQPASAEEPEPASEPEAPSDAINDALAAALDTSDTPAPVPTGPPLSLGEKEALRVAVGQCWNTGSLSTEALQTTVTVYVAMNEDGTPDAGSLRMVAFEGGSEAAAKRAYEAARRAIIRCGARGFNLPREKYSQWAEIEMIFNPNEMRIK